MFHINRKKELPARTILCDVVSRDGKADFNSRESSSPFRGMFTDVTKLGEGNVVSLTRAIANYDYDFNVQKIKPTQGAYVKRDNVSGISDYEPDLDNIDQSWIKAYVGQVKYAVEHNRTGVERLAREKSKDQPTTEDEDGDLVFMSELAVSEECKTDFSDLRQEVGYCVKRLSSYGDKYGIHMMSFIISVEKVKYARSQGELGSVSKNDGKPKQGEILDFGVYKSNGAGGYRVDADGNPIYWVKNDDTFRKHIYPFVTGNVDEEDRQYYEDYLHLLMDCQELGINLRYENPKVYTTQFICNVAVTYVMTNKKYLDKLYQTDYISTIINNISLSSYNAQPAVQSKSTDIYEIINRTLSNFYSISNPYILQLQETARVSDIERFLRRYGAIYPNINKDLNAYTFYKGFLADSFRKILYFDANMFLNIKETQSRKKNYFIIHKSGILILIENTNDIRYLRKEIYDMYFDDFFYAIPGSKIKQEAVYLNIKCITRMLTGKEYKITRRGYGYWETAPRL